MHYVMIEGSLEGLLGRVEISPEDREKARLVDSTVVGAAGAALGADVQVVSIGSSNRDTYVPNKYGLPGDVDLYIVGDAVGEGERDLATLIGLVGERKEELEANLSEIYRKIVELKLWRAENNEGKAIGGEEFVQARYEAVDKTTGQILLGLDFNYSGALDGPERYPGKFDERIKHIIAKLEPEERKTAREWIVSNIRGLKHLLSEEGIYKTKEGGFGGVGAEQLILQLNEGVQYGSLEEIKKNINVGGALGKIGRDGRNLKIGHPISGAELTEKLSRDDGAGWAKLLDVSRKYQDSFMYGGGAGQDNRASSLDRRVGNRIYLKETISDKTPRQSAAVSSPGYAIASKSLPAPAYA